MKIEVTQIMSMRINGGTCHLLILADQTHILLDCGLSPTFDFTEYRKHEKALQKVEIILLTHCGFEYIGALPFLIEEFKISPKVYATQPVVIFGPLNIHEAMVQSRYDKYTSETLKKIYLLFESIIQVKPLQRKKYRLEGSLQQPERDVDNPHHHNLHMVCYQAGSQIGSICWRISHCMFSCLYLVGYSNYKQYHVQSLDLDSILVRSTDVLITDCYNNEREKTGVIRREAFRSQIEEIVMNHMKFQDDRKLIFSCTPNERLAELINILTQMNADRVFEGSVDLVHYCSSYYQLVKSQTDYKVIDEIDEDEDVKPQNQVTKEVFLKDLNFSRRLNNRMCITTAACVRPQGILWQELCRLKEDSRLVRIGKDRLESGCVRDQIVRNLTQLPNLFEVQVAPVEAVKVQAPEEPKKVKEEPELKHERSIITCKYIHSFNFPRFVSSFPKHIEHDAYGQHYQDDFDQNYVEQEPIVEPEQPKKRTIDTQHVQFKLPMQSPVPFQSLRISQTELHGGQYLTTLQSSLQIVNLINPEKTILINGSSNDYDIYVKNRLMFLADRNYTNGKKYETVGFSERKKYFVCQNKSQTVEQTINLYSEDRLKVPDEKLKNFLKVQGSIILKPNNSIQIELVESGDRQLLQFNMAEFFSTISREGCRFTQDGMLQINDIRLSRTNNEITMEGMYSLEYFRLRQMLYQYIESHNL